LDQYCPSQLCSRVQLVLAARHKHAIAHWRRHRDSWSSGGFALQWCFLPSSNSWATVSYCPAITARYVAPSVSSWQATICLGYITLMPTSWVSSLVLTDNTHSAFLPVAPCRGCDPHPHRQHPPQGWSPRSPSLDAHSNSSKACSLLLLIIPILKRAGSASGVFGQAQSLGHLPAGFWPQWNA
jgi:hypothetical protein